MVDVVLRQMEENDLTEVSSVDALAFGTLKGRTPEECEGSKRTINNLLSNWLECPEGCFVTEKEGTIVGFVFCHLWGAVGWVGTYAVLPSLQTRGIGKRLLSQALGYINKNHCQTVGLETMPGHPSNVGYYMGFGFQPDYMTILFHRNLTHPLDGSGVESNVCRSLSSLPDLDFLSSISGMVQPGLDYTIPITRRLVDKEGILLTFGPEGRDGFALVRLRPTHNSDEGLTVPVKFLAINPSSELQLTDVVYAVERFSQEEGRESIIFPANTYYWNSVESFVKMGYKTIHTRLRMYQKVNRGNPNPTNLSSWVM